MFGGVGKAGWATILVTGGLMLGTSVSAQAADLGGDCCGDLEERVAELEATTARKGNRKVKLTVYGKVNQAVMFWDDGDEQNAYVVTNDASRSRFGFKGGAKINDDLSANFQIEIGVRSANSKRDNQFDAINADESGLDVRHAWWNLKSKKYGTIQVGHTPGAAQEITEINLAGTSDVGKYADVEDSGGGFFLVREGSAAATNGLQWRRLIARTGAAPGEGDRREAVLYESPEFAGFTASAAWGGDDFWDAGLRYEGEFGSIKVEAGIAYSENTDNVDDSASHGCPARNVDPNTNSKCQGLAGSISVLDTKSGLYGNFAAGEMWDDTVDSAANFAGTGVDDTYKFWAAEVGIQQKWNHLGKTTLFGQYYQYTGGGITQTVNGGDPINSFGAQSAQIFSSEVDMWGLGAMQKIDAADMKLYALYRHYEFDLQLARGGVVQDSEPLEDFQVLMTGAVINF
ncbi:porin [Hyphomicrobium sp.]|uniref:porin n=1 Tax=Hyphomicrobium sp. TaxID=82 RepID=UPI0025B9F095|nr:porin [Hyphomicrobium sp.]